MRGGFGGPFRSATTRRAPFPRWVGAALASADFASDARPVAVSSADGLLQLFFFFPGRDKPMVDGPCGTLCKCTTDQNTLI